MDDIYFSHGGNIYEVQRKFKKEVIDFSANINPLGLSHQAREVFFKNWDKIVHYPDSESRDLLKSIARRWHIKEENILLGNGSSELVYLLVSVLRPQKTVIPAPTFSEYERAIRSVKGKIKWVKLKEGDGFTLNLSPFCETDWLIICNPNNPTGNLLIKDRKIDHPFARFVLVDEAFLDFLPDEKRHTFVWKATQDKRYVVLRSFTKFFALPGLRIGYLIGHKDLIHSLKHATVPWNINVFAQLLAEVTISDKDYIRRTRELIRKEKDFLYRELSKMEGVKPYPSVTNFLLVKIEDGKINSFTLTRRLIHQGVFIRNCWNFKYLSDRFIRIAVRSHSENIKLIHALKEILWKGSF
ncbi:MAG: threonine-phosphate decarboxylase [Deltaproteobacteria bacterium]|nr:threonine-phosphate decarboxylase [Deltaproteobacteria bacterium]